MAIKKRPISPRQKMINLMYVVLMAMLALNTPTEEELGVKGKSLMEKVKRSLLDEPRKGDEKKDVKLVELNVSEMDAFVIPEKTTLYAGERFNSHVVMAAVDSTQRPEIYVNGSRLQAADGRYSFTAGGVGEHRFSGYILMKGKDGEEIRRNFSQKYTVLPVPNTATVAADLMNVLYAGYANPISISVPGVPVNAISATMTGGSFVAKGNGHFVATPSAVGKDVTIHVTARDKGQVRSLPPFVFHVRKLPDPTAYIAMGTDSGIMIQIISLIMINICDLHTRQMVPFSYIIRQNCLISHPHIIKNLKNLRVKMILVEVTTKNDYFFFLIKVR